MARIVLDNSVAVSSVLWTGRPRRLLERLREGRDIAYQTAAMWDELEAVLRRPRFAPRVALTGQPVDALLAELRVLFVRVDAPDPPTTRCRDPNDDMFLACAEAVQADYLISGDDDLLTMQRIGKTPIVSVSVFLAADEPPDPP